MAHLTENQVFNLVSGSAATGQSTYDMWKSIEGNEDKSVQDFLNYLKDDGESNVSEETLAQIEKNKNDISQLTATKVDLPKDADGKPIAPTEGQTILFKADGTTYYGTPSASGGSSGGDSGTTVHDIVWDLLNVTSSNNIVSIVDGSPLVAILTPSDGYALGDVTVTMGGEALTGVWNADTSTVAIASVTGDVIISCYGIEVGKADTTVEIAEEGYVWQSASTSIMVTKQARAGMGISKKYTFTPMREKFSALGIVSDDGNINSSADRNNYTPKIKMCQSNTNYLANGNVDSGHTRYTKVVTMKDDEPIYYCSGSYDGTEKTITVFSITPGFNIATVDGNALVFDIFIDDIDTAYAYWTSDTDTALFPDGVNKGDIIFAGKDTQYYGMKNIDGTMLDGSSSAGVLSLDDDIAMDYGIATTSIMGEEVATDPQTVYGLSSAFASVIDEARKAWMEEYKGDFRKIPIIVSTDQHGRRNNGIFNMLGKVLNMHDVSKVMNLGDTTSTWYDADTTKPLLTDATLDAWLESIKAIPYSKRLDVFGNHDTWYGNYEDEGNVIGTRYPSSQAHLNQYFRNIYARRTNNNGWFVTYDNHFNVKYVVVSAFEYQGTVTFRIGTEQMTWLIEELSKNDGYDVVIVSHVPLLDDPTQNSYPTDAGTNTASAYRVSELDTDALFSARKTKGSGTIVDSDGVTHNYDFTACKNTVLCSLHGHTHYDGYLYLNDSLLVNSFDWFDDNTFFFVLIDRVNNQLNVWKVDGTPQFINYQIPLDKPTE